MNFISINISNLFNVFLFLDLQSEPENVKVGTPEEKEARLLKALSLDKYMPSSFLTSKIVSTFKGKPVSPVVEEEKPVNPVSMNEKTGNFWKMMIFCFDYNFAAKESHFGAFRIHLFLGSGIIKKQSMPELPCSNLNHLYFIHKSAFYWLPLRKIVFSISDGLFSGDGSTETRTSDLPYGPPSDSSTSTVAQPVSLEIGSQSSQQVKSKSVIKLVIDDERFYH